MTTYRAIKADQAFCYLCPDYLSAESKTVSEWIAAMRFLENTPSAVSALTDSGWTIERM